MEKAWYRKMFSPSSPSTAASALETVTPDSPEAQFQRGLHFANAKGEAQDYPQAAEWYRKAAAQSHPLAQFNLGMMYSHGQGVAKDEAQALAWFGQAAHLGDAGAQFQMGRSAHRASLKGAPEGIAEARVEAYKWYHLADAQGYQGSGTACTSLHPSMTRADVLAGDKRIAEFHARTVTAGTTA